MFTHSVPPLCYDFSLCGGASGRIVSFPSRHLDAVHFELKLTYIYVGVCIYISNIFDFFFLSVSNLDLKAFSIVII